MKQSHFLKVKSLSPNVINNSTSCRMVKVHYHHMFTLLDPILSHMNPAQTLTPFSLTLYFFSYTYMPGFLKASSLLQFSD